MFGTALATIFRCHFWRKMAPFRRDIHKSFFANRRTYTIILGVCRNLYHEYLLIAKPCPFNFINSRARYHALLFEAKKQLVALQPFLCVSVGELLDFTSTNNFRSVLSNTLHGVSRTTCLAKNFPGSLVCPVIVLTANLFGHTSNNSGCARRAHRFPWFIRVESPVFINFLSLIIQGIVYSILC
jgi:hypothetical protein